MKPGTPINANLFEEIRVGDYAISAVGTRGVIINKYLSNEINPMLVFRWNTGAHSYVYFDMCDRITAA